MSDHAHHDSALAALDGERIVQPIMIRRDTMRTLNLQAAYAKCTPAQLMARLLDAVARDDDLLAEVLER